LKGQHTVHDPSANCPTFNAHQKQLSMSSIQLNLINHSNDHNNSSIVIVGKNVATGLNELAVAWQVIQHLGQGFSHPFTYDLDVSLAASDSYGNYSPQIPAENGTQFSMSLSDSGDVFAHTGQAASPTEIEVLNQLPQGAINAHVYRSGKLYATKTGIAPGQKAVFEFKPTIWIGVVSELQEGDIMNEAILSDINTELALLGITKANIIMTGGGTGADATPFQFSLQDVVYA
jgi:hypothetical protein